MCVLTYSMMIYTLDSDSWIFYTFDSDSWIFYTFDSDSCQYAFDGQWVVEMTF